MAVVINPFESAPLTLATIPFLYADRFKEEKLLEEYLYVNGMPKINCCCVGGSGMGKTTFMNGLIHKWQSEGRSIKTISLFLNSDTTLNFFLQQILYQYFNMKSDLTQEQSRIYQDIEATEEGLRRCKLPTDMLTSAMMNYTEKDLIILVDNAHNIIRNKSSGIYSFIESYGFELKPKFILFMDPKTHLRAQKLDNNGMMRRIGKTIMLQAMNFNQVEDMIRKRIDWVSQIDPKYEWMTRETFLNDSNINALISTFNGMPRPILETCASLFPMYYDNKTLDQNKVMQVAFTHRHAKIINELNNLSFSALKNSNFDQIRSKSFADGVLSWTSISNIKG